MQIYVLISRRGCFFLIILGMNKYEVLVWKGNWEKLAKPAKIHMRQESITMNYSCLRAAMIMSSRCLFNLLFPEECMHIALSFIGVSLQSGSGVLSRRVYSAHDWLSWFPSRCSRITLPHKLELNTFYFLAKEMSSDKWGWDEYHIIWGLRQEQGPGRRHFSRAALYSFHFSSPPPSWNIYFVH